MEHGTIPEEVVKAFVDLGEQQRGYPEQRMLDIQMSKTATGVYTFMVEHVGDISHRMTHMLKWSRGVPTPDNLGHEYVYDKADKCYKVLTSPYGFKKEMMENVKSNAEYTGVPIEEALKKLKALSIAYANAHRKLPAYNQAQRVAIDAAIYLGMWKFNDSAKCLKYLINLCKDKSKYVAETANYSINPINGKLIQL